MYDFVKIILEMLSVRTQYIAALAAIRYKKDEFPRKFVFFEANNLQLFACLFDSNRNGNSHTNHGVVTCADETHHLYVKLSYEEAFPINI